MTGADYEGHNLRGRDLRGADLRGANLRRAHLDGANLSGAELCGADAEGASFLGANLTGADLTELKAMTASFAGADFTGAVLLSADLRGAQLTSSNLSDADLRLSDLRGARFNDANLTSATLESADARDASFFETNVDRTSFRSVDLRDARIAHLRSFETADWVDANVSGADFRGAHDVRRFVADENYLYEFRTRSRSNALVFAAWKLTSDCGRDFGRWLAVIGFTVIAFALTYLVVDIDFGPHETAISPLYFSVVTATTLGFGDALPASIPAQLAVMCQVILGYIFLGGLVSILAEKLARRA